ncbi:MAG: DUF423 domain-containing protein [Armatimonadaceae bacterium]
MNLLLRLAAINGFLAVAIGAFGAHGLRNKVAPDLLEIYHTGADYHLAHALALLTLAAISFSPRFAAGTRGERFLRLSGILFAVGILIFSGSLYALALSGLRVLGAITPIGGVCFLSGWALLAFAVGNPAGSAGTQETSTDR